MHQQPQPQVIWFKEEMGDPRHLCGFNEPNVQLGLSILERTQIVTYGIKGEVDPLPCGCVVFVFCVLEANNEPESLVCELSLTRTLGP